jgi:proline iminopeptidase
MQRIDVDQTVNDLAAGQLADWIADHLRVYRESGGREGHLWDASMAGGRPDTPCLLLTTTGRHSGEARTMPLIYGAAGRAYVIIGSKGGASTQPAWYHNLCANPRVELQVGTQSLSAEARIASGAERARLWQMMVDVYPPYADYQRKTSREIPVVVLEPV